MPANLQTLPLSFGPAYIRPGCVTQSINRHTYRVRLDGQGEITAQMAVAAEGSLSVGDRVLAAGETPAAGFIIGILDTPSFERIRTPDGAGANLRGQGQDQVICVHDALQRPVFEYHPASGKSVIRAPEGDLRLCAPDGRIDLEAAEGIHCRSEADVDIRGRRSVRIAAQGRDGDTDQTLDMNGAGARLGVHQLDVTAGRGDITIARAVYRGIRLDSTVERARLVYDKLETTAQKIWQRSGYLIRQVRHLCQTKAGRMRTLIEGAHHTQSRRSTIIAEEDVRIDGKKINLG